MRAVPAVLAALLCLEGSSALPTHGPRVTVGVPPGGVALDVRDALGGRRARGERQEAAGGAAGGQRGVPAAVRGKTLRLRGGVEREVPLDMKIFAWWEESAAARVICGVFAFLAVYLLPLALPKITKPIPPQLVLQVKAGGGLLAAGLALFAAGPWLEEKLGWYSHGLAPFASTAVTGGCVLAGHAVMETVQSNLDAEMEADADYPDRDGVENRFRLIS